MREWLNVLAEQCATEARLREIARDRKTPAMKRAAAERALRTLEAGDLADFQEFLDGTATLKELRDRGLNTEVVRKARVRDRTIVHSDGSSERIVEREIELYDRSGEDFDRVCDCTEGRPPKRVEPDGDSIPQVVEVVFG